MVIRTFFRFYIFDSVPSIDPDDCRRTNIVNIIIVNYGIRHLMDEAYNNFNFCNRSSYYSALNRP